jgi:hypothetical protein
MEKKEHYSIIKVMGEKEVKVIDTLSEVLEFDNYEDAKRMADIMETNSDSGYKYVVNKI